tara:strand:+ start:457 stop:702 length:246 start_codon:yes stop_codon:yes gene_type:complete
MSDNEQIETLITRLEDGKNTHPNLCNLWINYIKLKKEAYENAIRQAETTINTLHESEDPEYDILVILFALSRIIRDRNNNT